MRKAEQRQEPGRSSGAHILEKEKGPVNKRFAAVPFMNKMRFTRSIASMPQNGLVLWYQKGRASGKRSLAVERPNPPVQRGRPEKSS
jgi:hypothetical protein